MTIYQTINLFHFLGWQGGNIHQVAALIGCEVYDLIYCEHNSKAPRQYLYTWGINWRILTESQRLQAVEKHIGYLEYWLGVRDSDLLIED